MSRREAATIYCRALSSRDCRMVPFNMRGSGNNAMCQKVSENGRMHPKALEPGVELIGAAVCNKALKDGSCPRNFRKIPKGLKIR